MGRTVSSHPGHLAGQSDPVIPAPSLIRPPSPASAPTDSAIAGKQACSHAPDTARTCSNSPLASSLSSTPPPTCYAAGPTSFSSSPFLSLTSNALVDGEDTFYDAVEQLPPQSHQPIRTNVEQIPAPKYQGAAKGRSRVVPSCGPSRGHNTYAQPATAAPTATPFAPIVFGRGPSRPTASSTPAQQSALAPSLSTTPTRSQRALLVGIDYAHFGKDKRLWYAAKDAARFGKSLTMSGFLPENIRCINDTGSVLPTREALKYHLDWLVRGAQKGDSLFFMFSGHCVKGRGLLTLDEQFISREDLHRALVLRVPEGCDLQIVFDCCHAASMVPLQYCVGHMAPPRSASPEPAQPEEPECPPEADPRSSDHASAQPRQDPLIGSLDGLAAVTAAPPSPDVTPEMVDLPTFAPAPSQRQRGGVVAAPPVEPVAAPAETVAGRATGFVASLFGFGQTAESPAVPAPGSDNAPSTSSRAPAAAKPWRGRQVVAEGERAPDYFAERKEGFIRPAGNVTVWAGTGEDQRAFEAYGNAGHGIVTHAICGALDACANSKLTRRDLWKYLVGEIDKENVHRGHRDAKKSVSDRPDPRMRVQHAELWVSQGRPLDSATSVLDQLVF